MVSANSSQMKIRYELNNAHVCHDNVCFKIPSVLVKNMTDKVILGLPFINALYSFLVEHDGITINPFGQKVKFKFASKFEIDTDYASNLIQSKVRHKKIAEQLPDKILQLKINNFQKILIDDVCYDAPNAFCHEKMHIDNLSYDENFPIDVFVQDLMIGSYQGCTDIAKGNTHSTKILINIDYPNNINISS